METVLTFGPFRLLTGQRLLLESGRPVRLGSRAFDLLYALMERAGEVVGKDDLIAKVWPNTTVEEANLRVHVGALRKALGDGHEGTRYIATIPGRGYSFLAAIGREEHKAEPVRVGREGPTLPARSVRLIGRNDTVDTICSELSLRRFVTVIGPGGIGKTAVALAVAEKATSAYKHGTRFVDLASLSDESLVSSALASVLGLAVQKEHATAAVISFLRDKSMLIVLDNCEHLIDAAAVLAEQLVDGAHGVAVLTTSREALRASPEWVYHLAPLAMPKTAENLTASDALAFPAVQLFAERAQACVDAFVMSDADVPSVVEICSRLDGIPLAIELAAARIDIFNTRELARRLDDRLALLTKGRRTALPRHRTLRAAIEWSYDLLSEKEKRALRRVAAFHGGFSLESAIALAAGGDEASSQTLDLILSLVSKSLISVDASDDTVLYRLLDTTRAYALERLNDSDDRNEIGRRHCAHFCDLFERAEAAWDEGGGGAVWLRRYGALIDDVRAALDWAFSPGGDVALGVRLTADSNTLWFVLSLGDEFIGRAERALAQIAAAGAVDSIEEMRLAAALGNALWHTGHQGARTATAFARTLAIAERHDIAAYRLTSLWGLSSERTVAGDHIAAHDYVLRFQALTQAIDDRELSLLSDRMLSITYHYIGQHAKAEFHGERGQSPPVASARRTRLRGVEYERASMATVVARIKWIRGFPDQAMTIVRAVIEDPRVVRHTHSYCYSLTMGAIPVAFWVGDDEQARVYVKRLQSRSAERSMNFLIHWGRNFELALDRRAASSAPNKITEGFVPDVTELDMLCTFDESFVNDSALARAEAGAADWCAPEVFRAQGELMARRGDVAKAQALFERAGSLSLEERALSWQLRAAISLAELWRSRDRRIAARDVLAPVLDQFSEGFATVDVLRAQRILTELA